MARCGDHTALDDARLDHVDICITPHKAGLDVFVLLESFGRTSPRLRALQAVQATACHLADAAHRISSQLLFLQGGEGVRYQAENLPDWLAAQLPTAQPLAGQRVAVLVMSDRAARVATGAGKAGDYHDKTGPVLMALAEKDGAEVQDYQVIPDDQATIAGTVQTIAAEMAPDIIFASGGTGPGPRDITPEALTAVSQRMMTGLGDYLRSQSLHYTDTAWLSRMTAGMVGATLVIAMPGSPNAVTECWHILQPFLGDALRKIKKQGFQ
jgi:molybdenum cofactor synthesis domain-containing protein